MPYAQLVHMNGGFWVCPHCGSRNKGFAAVCLRCSRERRGAAPTLERRPPYADRFRVTRATRLLLVAALATGVGLAVLLVRTFRGPAIDAAGQVERATTSSPITPRSVEADGAPGTAAPSGPDLQEDMTPRRPAASRPPVTPAPRSPHLFTDADLRAYAAQRGGTAVSDAGYRIALRQRRVNDLRARLAVARSEHERAALQEWLDGALRDLEAEQARPR